MNSPSPENSEIFSWTITLLLQETIMSEAGPITIMSGVNKVCVEPGYEIVLTHFIIYFIYIL